MWGPETTNPNSIVSKLGKEGGCKRKRAAVSKQTSSLREEFGLLISNSDTGQRLAGLLGHCPAKPICPDVPGKYLCLSDLHKMYLIHVELNTYLE